MVRVRLSLWKTISMLVVLLALPVTVALVGEATNYLTRAGGEKASLVVDISKSKIAKPSVWANFAQGGEERENMLASVAGQVRGLGASYIRIDHIYDFYDVVARSADGNLVYDWSKLDEQVRGIKSAGAIPFLSLSYMPSAISSGSEVDYPNNWSDWENVVKQTVERYSGKTNIGTVGVYYEVWNEPDLFGGFRLYGDKNYLELYKHSAMGAMRAQNVSEFKLGGPATTGLYENWVRDFLSFTKANNLRLDFYSWHRYDSTLNGFDADIREIRTLHKEFPEYSNLELIVSETGYSSANDSAYDGALAAMHTLATVTTLDQEIDKLFSFEIKDGPGPEQYWGRWGMLTHEKYGVPVKKPRYRAIEFLNQMIGRHVEVSGEGSWVRAFARSTSNGVKVLVVNYDPSGKNQEAIPIEFRALPANEFTYVRQNFLGRSSARTVNNIGNVWSTVELLEPNTAVIIEISY